MILYNFVSTTINTFTFFCVTNYLYYLLYILTYFFNIQQYYSQKAHHLQMLIYNLDLLQIINQLHYQNNTQNHLLDIQYNHQNTMYKFLF